MRGFYKFTAIKLYVHIVIGHDYKRTNNECYINLIVTR